MLILVLSLLTQSLLAETLNIIGIPGAPYRFYNEENQLVGFDVDILNEVMTTLDLEYKIELLDSSTRLTQMWQSPDVDMVFTLSKKAQRLKLLTYAEEPHINLSWNFFIRKSNEGKIKYDTLDDLKGLKVGATKSFAYTDEFWAADLDLDVMPNNDKQLKKLINNRFDVVPMTTLSTLHKARINGQIDKITFLPKVLVYTKLYNTFTKTSTYPNKAKLIREYNLTIKKLTKSGQIQAIFDKYNYSE